MSEDELKSNPFLQQLAAFRPNPDAVNRDELLYQAGRASALAIVNRITESREQRQLRQARFASGVRLWQGASAMLACLLLLCVAGWATTSSDRTRHPPVFVGRTSPQVESIAPASSAKSADPVSYAALIHEWNERGSLPDLASFTDPSTPRTPVTAGQLRSLDID